MSPHRNEISLPSYVIITKETSNPPETLQKHSEVDIEPSKAPNEPKESSHESDIICPFCKIRRQKKLTFRRTIEGLF